MATSRLVNSTGLAFSALVLAAVATVASAIPTGAVSPETSGRIAADHGWGRKAADVPASPDGLVVLADGTEDHGWG